ncbi:MAG: hypothetical protein ACK4YP_18875 [Myxococcota bacterium]
MRPSRTSRSLALVLLLGGALLGGCQPGCEQVCDKLVACDMAGTERMNAAECEVQCNEQQELYATWSDTELRASFDAHLSCLNTSTCEEIEGGACYDEEVFSF